MLKQIDFSTNTGCEYIMLYMSDKLTDEQALKECEFVGCGGGCDWNLYPYYLIIPKKKRPLLMAIKEHILSNTDESEDE